MSAEPPPPVRRVPPAFRRLVVVRTEWRTPHLVRITFGGPELDGFAPPLPAGSVRLLIPDLPAAELIVPEWNGNAFMHADGRRPLIRTVTPLRRAAGELDVEVVLHEDGPLSAWAGAAEPGAVAAFSGPGRGYALAYDDGVHLLAGDESALPAIGQLVAALAPDARATVIVEVGHPDARLELTGRDGVDVRWVDRRSTPGDALVPAVLEAQIAPDTLVWVAGEAAAVQRIRRELFTVRGTSRARATIRGYWKHGRSDTGEDAA